MIISKVTRLVVLAFVSATVVVVLALIRWVVVARAVAGFGVGACVEAVVEGAAVVVALGVVLLPKTAAWLC